MGRAKLKMELIEKPKQRLLTFKKRKEGLMKKLHQLSTLCDVAACMIIVDPFQNQTSIWSEQNPDHVRRLIEAYRSKDMSSVKSYGLAEFFAERKKKVEEELHKLRKANSQAKFPTWIPAFDSMSDAHLRALAASLLGKSQAIRSRIQAMRAREAQDLEMMKTKMLLLNSNHHFYNLDHHHHQEFKPQQQIPMNMQQQIPMMNMQQQQQIPMMNMQQQIPMMNMQQQIPMMNMQQQQQQVVPQNYYVPQPPMPSQPQPYMIWPANMQLQYYPTSSMDQNPVNYWVEDDAGEASRYLIN